MLNGLRMKRLPLYFNKGVTLLVLLAMQMEAFAQRGRAIPQDWGGGGDSYILMVVVICFIILYVQ